MPNRNPRLVTLVLPVLVACSSDVVNLGANANELTAPDSPCQTGASSFGSVFVQSQADLDALAGCEVIEGDLFIYPFAGADFRALAALRVVEGELDVGRLRFNDPEITGATGAERDADVALQESGWIASLAGFESLESVGALHLRGVGADTLQPLSGLRAVTQGGLFEIGPCVNLRSLEGLENVTGLVNVRLVCDSLETIAGLALPSRIGSLFIEGASLTDLGAFDVTMADSLTVIRTGLADLDALSSLSNVQRLLVNFNPALTDAEGIGAIDTTTLMVAGNAVLERLPDFESVSLIEALEVSDNPSLVELPSFPALQALFEREAQFDEPLPPTPLNLDADYIVIRNNASLVELTLPLGLPGVRYVEIAENAALSRIDVADVRAMDFLLISENAALESVDLGSLETVDELRVTGNPALPLDDFATVRTFSSQLSPDLPLEVQP